MLHFPLLQCQPPSLHPRWSPADPTRGRYMSRETCLPSKIVLKIFSLTQKVFLWKMGLVVVFLIALCSELCSLTGSSFSPPPEQEEKRETQKTRQSSIDYWIWWWKWNSEFMYMFICIPQGNYIGHRMSLSQTGRITTGDTNAWEWGQHMFLLLLPPPLLISSSSSSSSSSSHRSLRTMLFLQPPPTTLPRSPLLPHFPQDEKDNPSNHSNT